MDAADGCNLNQRGHVQMKEELVMTNGSTVSKITGTLNQVLDLVEDHIELAHLEYRYEKDESWRRLGIGALVSFCALSAFLFIQIAVILALRKAGLPLYAICLLFAALYAASAVWIHQRFNKRNPAAGEPFQGSREELTRSFQWIHRLLS